MGRRGQVCATFTFEGKRYYNYALNQRDAQRKADQRLALMQAGVKQITSTTTVNKWASEWLKTYKCGTVSDKWYDHMESIIRKVIVPQIGHLRLKDVKPMHIQAMYNSQLDMSESHQRKLQLVTRQIFDCALENDLINKDPSRRVKVAPRAGKSGYRTITEEERDLTIRTAEKHQDIGLFFLIMLYCGCRPQEVSRLVMSDYDADKKILTISRARKKDGDTGSPKSSAGYREIPVPTALSRYLDNLNKMPNELIITSHQGRPLTETSQRRMWSKFKRQMEIEKGAKLYRMQVVNPTLADDFVPYCYRHTYCTDLQDAGVPVTVAQRLMGHSSIKMTADIYTHHSKESFDDARDKIDKHQDKIIGKVNHARTTPTTTIDRQ